MAHTQDVLELSGFLPVIRLGPAVEVPTYYLVISLAFCSAVIWLSRRAAAAGLPRTTAMDTGLAVMVGGFLGARLTHVLYEAPSLYLAEPERVMRVWEGGFVWYGGALTGAAAGVLFLRLRKWDLAPWLDVFAPIGAAGYAVGRGACLLTGCCFGRVCYFPSGFALRFPTQAFAVVWETAVLAGLIWLEKRRERFDGQAVFGFIRRPGALFAIWISAHALGRILMEAFRDDERGPFLLGLSFSTIVSFVLLIAALIACTALKRLGNSKKSGL